MSDKPIKYDLDGEKVVSTALKQLLNSYPALSPADKISFSSLAGTTGIAFYPTSGSAVRSEVTDVTGHTTQICTYPFIVINRGSGLNESRRQKVEEWLNALGRWLEKQTITVNGIDYKLMEYPSLSNNREIKEIARQTSAYIYATSEDKTEEWAINLQLTYRNEYDK